MDRTVNTQWRKGPCVASRRIAGFAIGASRRAEKYLADLSIGARFITIARSERNLQRGQHETNVNERARV